jgi:hypothetical protein
MNLEIKAQGFFCNTWPVLTITQNGTKFEYSVENETDVSIVLDNAPFQLGMYNKSFGTNRVWDTKTDNNGNIVQDKFIKFTKISIDDVSVLPLLIKIDYNSKEQGCHIVHDACLRFNGDWHFPIGDNPYDWIIDTTYQQTNEYRDTSYFSDYTIINNYSEHYQYITKIRNLLDI